MVTIPIIAIDVMIGLETPVLQSCVRMAILTVHSLLILDN